MSLDLEDLEYLAKEIPRLTAAFAPTPDEPRSAYAVQCRWSEGEIRSARESAGELSDTPLDRALEWLNEPQGERSPVGEPWVAGVRSDVLEDGTEGLIIAIARAFVEAE